MAQLIGWFQLSIKFFLFAFSFFLTVIGRKNINVFVNLRFIRNRFDRSQRVQTFSTLTFLQELPLLDEVPDPVTIWCLFLAGLGSTFGGGCLADDMLVGFEPVAMWTVLIGSDRGGGEHDADDSLSQLLMTMTLAVGLVVMDAVFENELSFFKMPFSCFCCCWPRLLRRLH